MEAREAPNEPEPEKAIEGDDQGGGFSPDRRADVRWRLAGLAAASEPDEPGPADDLDSHAEGGGRGDEEQEEAVVAGLG